MNRNLSNRHQRFYRAPNFDSGIIPEPSLAFGGNHTHPDPKTGLYLYGPYTVADQSTPLPSRITVGLIGTGKSVANTEQWLNACQHTLTNDGSEPFLYPHFPGFNSERPFLCRLSYGDTWREIIREETIESAINSPNFYDRIKSIVNLYLVAVETLSQRDPRPDVILCCIPQEVVDFCTVRTTRTGEEKRIRKPESEKRLERIAGTGQAFMFPEMDPSLGIEDDESGHQNLRRGLKAEAMQFGIPTQLIWPRTVQLSESISPGMTKVQDVATRAWNLMTAIYHKAGGTPWRLANVEQGTCFIGISFYRETTQNNPHLRTAMAQTFTAAGDGYVLRGNTFEWNDSRSQPHLDSKSAAGLIRDVLSLYQRQNRGMIPSRIIVHKSSRFFEEELVGFKDACELIPRKDFVSFGQRGIQFYRTGQYPPVRGTFIKFSDTDLLLYTVGYIPFLRTYPGARVPQPMEILEHIGDSPWNVILQEILSLTKMNWNTADFACSEPITLAFSHRVGQILAELPSNLPLRHEYRYYM